MACEEALLHWDTLAKHAKKVAERYPSDATIQVYLARAYISLGKRILALNTYKRVIQIVPGHIEATRFIAASSN
jgi:tetratricopeptide (TPR) repeat protein